MSRDELHLSYILSFSMILILCILFTGGLCKNYYERQAIIHNAAIYEVSKFGSVKFVWKDCNE